MDDHFGLLQKTVQQTVGEQMPADWLPLFEQHRAPGKVVLQRRAGPPGHLYFVVEGWLRLHSPLQKGGEATTQIAGPGQWIVEPLAFIHQQPAAETLSSLGPALMLRIAHSKLKPLVDADPLMQKLMLMVFEQMMTAVDQRNKALSSLSATDRYAQLMAERPNWLAQLPLRVLASYLGVQPESLSRIRAKRIS